MFDHFVKLALKGLINPFPTNVPIMDKPGSWFLLAMFQKHLCKSDILSKDAGQDIPPLSFVLGHQL